MMKRLQPLLASSFWRTLRFRFALSIVILLFVVLLGFGIFVYATLKQSLIETLDERLRVSATQMQAIIEAQNGDIQLPQNSNYDVLIPYLDQQDLDAQILTRDGDSIFSYGCPIPAGPHVRKALDEAHANFATLRDPNEPEDFVRVYTAPIRLENQIIGVVEVSERLESIEDTLERLLRLLQIGVPLFALGAGFGGYVLVARALGRIDRITETAQNIAASQDLSARLRLPDVDDEVGRLSRTFDTMLARLEVSFKQEQQFVNDAAHELRTPLTVMRTVLETIRIKRRSLEQYEEALDDVGEEVNRLQRLVDALMSLIDDNSSGTISFERVNLSTLLADLCESVTPLAAAKGLNLTCRVPSNMIVLGDSDNLIRLFYNLVDNAIKYTDQGRISVEGDHSSQVMLRVSISDTGKGITVEKIPHIFDRFYRAEASRTSQGIGLGLSIVEKIVATHGGHIEVTSTPSQGSTFIVRLPKAP